MGCEDRGGAGGVYATDEKRVFETGASRDTDAGKFDYEGFLSPLVLESFAAYMHKNRQMRDGSLRDSDNWQKGIPQDQYMKSLMRHVHDVWMIHRGFPARDGVDIIEAFNGVLFNAMGYMFEVLKESLGDDDRFVPTEAALYSDEFRRGYDAAQCNHTVNFAAGGPEFIAGWNEGSRDKDAETYDMNKGNGELSLDPFDYNSVGDVAQSMMDSERFMDQKTYDEQQRRRAEEAQKRAELNAEYARIARSKNDVELFDMAARSAGLASVEGQNIFDVIRTELNRRGIAVEVLYRAGQ